MQAYATLRFRRDNENWILRSRSFLAPLTQPLECFIAVNRLCTAAFQVVVPAVEHEPGIADPINESGDCVSGELIRTTPGSIGLQTSDF